MRGIAVRALRDLYVIRGGLAKPFFTVRADSGDSEGEAQDSGKSAAEGTLGRLRVDFSRYDTWYRIDSFWEGTFLERTKKGAFAKTLAERGLRNKMLFNHGMDYNIGDKALAVPDTAEEGDEGPYLEGDMLDTSYNRDLEPGLRAGAYGSSFMFEVLGESWTYEPEPSDHNPDALPERTLTEVRTFEAGPVTWPANDAATATLRSGTDWLVDEIGQRDKARYDELVRSFETFRERNRLAVLTAPDVARGPGVPVPSKGRHATGVSAAARARRMTLLNLERT